MMHENMPGRSRPRPPDATRRGQADGLSPLVGSGRRSLLGRPCPLGIPFSKQDNRFVLFDTDHIAPRNEFVKEILGWLDKYLGPVRRGWSG